MTITKHNVNAPTILLRASLTLYSPPILGKAKASVIPTLQKFGEGHIYHDLSSSIFARGQYAVGKDLIVDSLNISVNPFCHSIAHAPEMKGSIEISNNPKRHKLANGNIMNNIYISNIPLREYHIISEGFNLTSSIEKTPSLFKYLNDGDIDIDSLNLYAETVRLTWAYPNNNAISSPTVGTQSIKEMQAYSNIEVSNVMETSYNLYRNIHSVEITGITGSFISASAVYDVEASISLGCDVDTSYTAHTFSSAGIEINIPNVVSNPSVHAYWVARGIEYGRIFVHKEIHNIGPLGASVIPSESDYMNGNQLIEVI
jgi:hypothetical protein